MGDHLSADDAPSSIDGISWTSVLGLTVGAVVGLGILGWGSKQLNEPAPVQPHAPPLSFTQAAPRASKPPPTRSTESPPIYRGGTPTRMDLSPAQRRELAELELQYEREYGKDWKSKLGISDSESEGEEEEDEKEEQKEQEGGRRSLVEKGKNAKKWDEFLKGALEGSGSDEEEDDDSEGYSDDEFLDGALEDFTKYISMNKEMKLEGNGSGDLPVDITYELSFWGKEACEGTIPNEIVVYFNKEKDDAYVLLVADEDVALTYFAFVPSIEGLKSGFLHVFESHPSQQDITDITSATATLPFELTESKNAALFNLDPWPRGQFILLKLDGVVSLMDPKKNLTVGDISFRGFPLTMCPPYKSLGDDPFQIDGLSRKLSELSPLSMLHIGILRSLLIVDGEGEDSSAVRNMISTVALSGKYKETILNYVHVPEGVFGNGIRSMCRVGSGDGTVIILTQFRAYWTLPKPFTLDSLHSFILSATSSASASSSSTSLSTLPSPSPAPSPSPSSSPSPSAIPGTRFTPLIPSPLSPHLHVCDAVNFEAAVIDNTQDVIVIAYPSSPETREYVLPVVMDLAMILSGKAFEELPESQGIITLHYDTTNYPLPASFPTVSNADGEEEMVQFAFYSGGKATAYPSRNFSIGGILEFISPLTSLPSNRSDVATIEEFKQVVSDESVVHVAAFVDERNYDTLNQFISPLQYQLPQMNFVVFKNDTVHHPIIQTFGRTPENEVFANALPSFAVVNQGKTVAGIGGFEPEALLQLLAKYC
eukprot:TRINITY_DN511_c7_g1_i1.p1 TRINITY_DN511_c7_g1~~TRINITY_DN511_c7_g1_i1.p1  ORF type:complete len:766 (-),score=209.32 TRINITY_DN511_c7_g1_i1:81-2378(-)